MLVNKFGFRRDPEPSNNGELDIISFLGLMMVLIPILLVSIKLVSFAEYQLSTTSSDTVETQVKHVVASVKQVICRFDSLSNEISLSINGIEKSRKVEESNHADLAGYLNELANNNLSNKFSGKIVLVGEQNYGDVVSILNFFHSFGDSLLEVEIEVQNNNDPK